MDSLARPQDLLLAYDAGFTGYTSLSGMAQPLEPESSPAAPTALGGTASPDGYFEDFTASLGRFVKNNPTLLASAHGGRKTGGAGAPSRALNWKTMVISFDIPGDDDAGDEGERAGNGDEAGDEAGDDYEDDGDEGERADNGDEAGDDYEDGDGGGDAVGGTRPNVVSLGDFIVGADEYVGGEMDETDAEAGSYESFRAGPEAGLGMQQESILGFVADK